MRNRGTMRAARAMLFVACCVSASGARADAISPAPACPPGSLGRSSHAGQWCAAAPCTEDTDCKREGHSCKKWRVCQQAAMVSHNRRRPHSSRMVQVISTCAPRAACKGDEEPPPPLVGKPEGETTCTTGQYCLPASLPALPAPAPEEDDDAEDEEDDDKAPKARAPRTSDGCGCRSRSAAAQGGASVLVALGLLLMVRRRS